MSLQSTPGRDPTDAESDPDPVDVDPAAVDPLAEVEAVDADDGTSDDVDGVTDLLAGERELLVVSNREPYQHRYRDDGQGIVVDRPVGGLTAGLDQVMQRTGGTWIAWGDADADPDVVNAADCVEVPPEDPKYTLRRVWLGEQAMCEYYYGFSNQVLWPLCHSLVGKANFEGSFWDRYHAVNERFADIVAEQTAASGLNELVEGVADDAVDDETGEVDVADVDGVATVESEPAGESDDADGSRGPIVWFQDYHLALAPRMARESCPDATFVQFWHIPWPAWNTFRVCPQRRELLTGLLGNDLLGFHVERYCEQFLDCVEACLDEAVVDRERGTVEFDGRTTYVRPFPMSVDAERTARLSAERGTEFWDDFRERYGIPEESKVAVGVERLDYTKGIPQRLDALEQFWETHPEWRETFTYVQKASESRSEIPAYQNLAETVREKVDAINERFGTDDWTPVVYLEERLPDEDLYGLYRHSDLALVTPIRDGMNLVAKEYVAAQVDDDGVLLLSELAGANENLGDLATTVEPYDTDGFAETIAAALEQDEPERKRQMHRLRDRVRSYDLDAWISSIFEAVDDVERERAGARESLSDDVGVGE